MDYLLWLNYRSNVLLNFNPDDETCCVEEIDADIRKMAEKERRIKLDILLFIITMWRLQSIIA